MLAATDPAQPYGGVLRWPERPGGARGPQRVAGAYVVLVGAEPVIYVERGGRGLQVLDRAADAAREPRARRARGLRDRRRREAEARRSSASTASPSSGRAWETALIEAGFCAGPAQADAERVGCRHAPLHLRTEGQTGRASATRAGARAKALRERRARVSTSRRSSGYRLMPVDPPRQARQGSASSPARRTCPCSSSTTARSSSGTGTIVAWAKAHAGPHGSFLPGLNIPVGSSASLTASCAATARGRPLAREPAALEHADAVLAADRAAQLDRQSTAGRRPRAARGAPRRSSRGSSRNVACRLPSPACPHEHASRPWRAPIAIDLARPPRRAGRPAPRCPPRACRRGRAVTAGPTPSRQRHSAAGSGGDDDPPIASSPSASASASQSAAPVSLSAMTRKPRLGRHAAGEAARPTIAQRAAVEVLDRRRRPARRPSRRVDGLAAGRGVAVERRTPAARPAGAGISRSHAAVTIPSVPSEPISSPRRS